MSIPNFPATIIRTCISIYMSFIENPRYVDLLTLDKEAWKEIWRKNLLLSPETLGEFFPAYNQFKQIPDQPLLWSKTGAVEQPVIKPIIVAWNGPTASGKTDILKYLKEHSLFPFIRIITTTSRIPRQNEKKRAYNFMTTDEFREGIEDGVFIEYKPRKNNWYGTPYEDVRKELDKARKEKTCLLIWGGDIDGLERFKPNIWNEFQIPVPSVFLLPEMPIQSYRDHVQETRPTDWETRLLLARWEIEHAPERVDYFVKNPFPNGFRNTVDATVTLFRGLCGEPL
ncbi:hypothetical protein MUP56_01490 [Patescibacteria group bacterium]|nr:hypothetical protein [Patescibacteria group bacterium]